MAEELQPLDPLWDECITEGDDHAPIVTVAAMHYLALNSLSAALRHKGGEFWEFRVYGRWTLALFAMPARSTMKELRHWVDYHNSGWLKSGPPPQ